jgi:osmotically-inducible protein OsmY
VGIGTALVAYLFDPERGKGRRAKLRDQTKSRIRKVQDATRRQVEFQSNRVMGLAHELMSEDASPVLDDDLILQKVKSEVIGPAQLPSVEVDVRNGVVTISGDIDDAQYRRLAIEIGKISGVESVDQAQAASSSRDRS